MFKPGESFARFTIEKKLGEGGMGEVYLATDQKLNRKVALKILLSEFFDNQDRMDRFSREARTAAKITHPNVMAIYDMDTAKHEGSGKKVSYIVMELIGGESLTEYLSRRNPAMKELLRISEKIASGLAAAHKLGIVHRDIKTDNIMIDEHGEPKVLDFGLAKPTDTVKDDSVDSTNTVSRELTQEGKILGTVSYMSPEQARGETVDTRSDVFSFGILIYRMFTGQSPFEAPDRVSVMAKILEGKAAPMRQINQAVPTELERIVDKCLQKDPNDRYQSTRDLVVDLRSLRRQHDSGISTSTSVTAEAAAAKPKQSTWYSSLPVKIGLGVVGLIAVITVAVIVMISSWASNDSALDSIDFGSDITKNVFKSLEKSGIKIDLKTGRVDLMTGQIPGLSRPENGLAILGFENKTGDTAYDWLSAGLPEILLTDLAQNQSLHLISRNRVLDCLGPDAEELTSSQVHEQCVKAAQSLGASSVLSGSFFKMGSKLRIDARLEDPESGEIVLAEKVVGDDPFVLVDSLTNKIAASMNLAIDKSDDVQVADITSSSPEAYREYILGMEKFMVSLNDEAIDHFEKAIEIDSTFAMPYMRIGMAYTFQGRQQLGLPYFIKAQEYENKLPIKERSLLDIYVDTWLHSQIDDAFTKLKAYVSNYPEDKEGRSIYALFLSQIISDDDGALAQLDTVFMLDPRFPLALNWKVTIHRSLDQWDEVIKYSRLIREYYPESPNSYANLASVYLTQSRLDDAIAECETMRKLFPDNQRALGLLGQAYIRKRDFQNARRIALLRTEISPDDPYIRATAEQNLYRIALWTGKFQTAIDHMKTAADVAETTGDSAQIWGCYSSIAERFIDFGMPDSATIYAALSNKWSPAMMGFDYPLLLAKLGGENIDTARQVFTTTMDKFKSRVPSEMWYLGDILSTIFNGLCDNDTLKMIEGMSELLESNQNTSANLYILGSLEVLTGQFESGKEHLLRVISGDNETINGFRYIRAVYYIGVANEGLGNTDEAVANYQEVLKYWGDPEIELKEIKDTRERLNRLTS